MKITNNDSFLRLFFYVTAVLLVLGVVMNIAAGTSDIYQVWMFIAYVVGAYLINKYTSDTK